MSLPWSCDFGDPSRGLDTCDFEQDSEDSFDWTVNYGGTDSDDTGPPEDDDIVEEHGIPIKDTTLLQCFFFRLFAKI